MKTGTKVALALQHLNRYRDLYGEVGFEVVNVHDALPKREYMITAKCDRQIDRNFD